ncbi:MAG: PucC family protein, partial [Pseudomonadota bacterium]
IVAAIFLQDFTTMKLVQVVAGISVAGVAISFLAMWGLEKPRAIESTVAKASAQKGAFMAALKTAWDDPQARLFTIFVFISMLGYSAQDLVLEPFAGIIFDFTVSESTALTSQMHSGALIGMIGTAIVATVFGKSRARFMRLWTIIGCVSSAIAFMGLVSAAAMPDVWPLIPTVFVLGITLGIFTVAAIGSMMVLASAGEPGREGTRMGLWGASQAIAMGLGALLGTIILDVSRWIIGSAAPAYAIVFATEAVLFIIAAICASLIGRTRADDMDLPVMPSAELVSAE